MNIDASSGFRSVYDIYHIGTFVTKEPNLQGYHIICCKVYKGLPLFDWLLKEWQYVNGKKVIYVNILIHLLYQLYSYH